MVYVKYTREMLSEAVAASTSVAAVMRHLGLRQNGGTHTNLRRRIDKFGIDTSHFLGQAHFRGVPDPNRRRPDEILILRPETANREKPAVLRRALVEMGRPYRCTACETGDSWNGRPLILHVDHIDGRMWDCRPHNVRFLCPNCHSQTATYAGRKSRQSPAALVEVDDQGNRIATAVARKIVDGQQIRDVLLRVERDEILPSQAARLIGCSRSHVRTLRRRLAERGSVDSMTRPPIQGANHEAVIAFALANPALGARSIAAALARRQPDPIMMLHGTVGGILSRAGLSTQAARTAATATRPEGV